jgi:alpha-tubulin suppressor-like RCC1 family protein
MNSKTIFAISVLALVSSGAGCGPDGSSGQASLTGADGVIDVTFTSSALTTLPACTTTNAGTLAFISSPAGLWSCANSTWTAVACTTALAGKVLFASTTQTVVAACVHSTWTQVTGPKGPTGPTGATGAKGPVGDAGPPGVPGAMGTPAVRSLVVVSAEPHGATCLNGGQRVDIGVDTSGDGVLQSGEIKQTTYVCDGTGEPPGATINGQPALAVASGRQHACALLGDGSVWCWGEDSTGALGKPASALGCGSNQPCPSPHPIQVPGVGGTGVLTGATGITGGSDHTCALLGGGTVACWGDNSFGQLGQDNALPVTTPVVVKGVGGSGTLGNVAAISAGYHHTCARLASGGIDCWGDNTYGQLGNGTSTGGSSCGTDCWATPVAVTVSGGAALANSAVIVSGSTAEHACSVQTNQTMLCWGLNTSYQLAVTDVGVAGPENCANQQCSTRALPVKNPPGPITGGAAGEAHTCGLFADRTVICWGLNESGQLGFDLQYGQDQQSLVIPVTNLAGVLSLAAGSSHTCALLAGGTEMCWGGGSNGDLGVGSDPGLVTTPVVVGNLHGVRAISAGLTSSCAIGDRAVDCWGRNGSGQAGDGVAGPDVFWPSVVR